MTVDSLGGQAACPYWILSLPIVLGVNVTLIMYLHLPGRPRVARAISVLANVALIGSGVLSGGPALPVVVVIALINTGAAFADAI